MQIYEDIMVSGGTMNLVNGIWANIIKRKNKKR
jgi:uncharacterized membrane protein